MADKGTVKVVHAIYGALRANGRCNALDVTAAVQKLADKNPNSVTINNESMGGDPSPGLVKHFAAYIAITGGFYNGQAGTFACQEGQTLDFFNGDLDLLRPRLPTGY